MWFAAQASALSLDAHVYSLDISKVNDVHDDDVTFLQGDIHQLGESPLAAFRGRHPNTYRIADECCHFFGHNVTWNPNGYLQRI